LEKVEGKETPVTRGGGQSGGGETKRADDGARVDLFEVLRDAVATTARRGLERALL
jgi:hypothetical protein